MQEGATKVFIFASPLPAAELKVVWSARSCLDAHVVVLRDVREHQRQDVLFLKDLAPKRRSCHYSRHTVNRSLMQASVSMDSKHLDERIAVERIDWWHVAKRELVTEILQRPPLQICESDYTHAPDARLTSPPGRVGAGPASLYIKPGHPQSKSPLNTRALAA